MENTSTYKLVSVNGKIPLNESESYHEGVLKVNNLGQIIIYKDSCTNDIVCIVPADLLVIKIK